MNNEQTPALRQAVESMATMREAYDNLSQAAEAYNVGKTQLAAAITSKGVETSPTETYPEMAEKVNGISQETYQINGGEMYAKQLFGSLETPKYWNLYDVLAQLLSDGRLVQYGGILLAEYYRGYDSLVLAGAGSGGAYVVSDKDENGQFKMYTEDTTHTWETEFDGKGNRWVAYCFADEYHDFQITNTNTSPRSIFIGRKVGTITSLVNGRVSQIVVPDGNELRNFNTNQKTQNWNKRVVIRNIVMTGGSLIYGATSVESYYFGIKNATGGVLLENAGGSYTNNSIIIESESLVDLTIANETAGGFFYTGTNTLSINCPYIRNLKWGVNGRSAEYSSLKLLHITTEDAVFYTAIDPKPGDFKVVIDYITNDKNKSVAFNKRDTNPSDYNFYYNVTDAEVKQDWCKPLDIRWFIALTEANIYAHILQRLKQDEPDCGDGVTITLGSTNLAKLTSEESQSLLAELRGTYGYTFA